MADGQIFTSRLRGRPLLDSKGMTIGRIRDVVLFPSAGNEPPRALGLVVTLQRRRIFVNLGQVTEISIDGAHLPGGSVELERFNRRTGEVMASELYGQHTGDGTIVDVAISPSDGNRAGGRSPRWPSRTAGACFRAARGSCRGTSTPSCSKPTR